MTQGAVAATNKMAWIDLGSRDMDAAKRFYSTLFGWTPEVQPGDQMGGYTVFHLDGKSVGGLMSLADTPAAPVAWLPYISVGDVRDVVARAVTAGANVIVEPMEVATNLTFAIIMDPAGSPIGLLQPRDVSGWQVSGPTANSVCWQELHSTDVEASKTFYAGVFGWLLESPPEFGGYTVCKVDAADTTGFAGITSTENAPMRNWVTYINVENCDQMAARATEAGGTVVVAPQDIPGIGRYAIIHDTEGGELGLLQPAPQM